MNKYIEKQTSINPNELTQTESLSADEDLRELNEAKTPEAQFYRGYVDAVFDLGDRAISATIVPIGILASGNPTLSAAFIAASNLGPIAGLAKPISSYAITDSLLNKDSI